MPEINWTLDIGDLIIAGVALILVPTAKMTISTLSSIRRAVEDLTLTMYGSTRDPSIGIVTRTVTLEKTVQRHHQRIADVEMETGVKRERS